uniref:Uncharacterized protein n=1 Tax=Panagrolaimus superbus TaxID=310955 RepID=A0A914XQY7_9BILA
MDQTIGIKNLTSYYCDLLVFQKLIENIRTVIDKKRLGFQYLSNYLTQVNTKNEENFRGHLTIFLDNINLAQLYDFIGEALVHTDVRIPTSILHNVIPKVPSLENPPKTLQAIRNISDMTEPLGFYTLPRFVAACNYNCPHNSKQLNGEHGQTISQSNPNFQNIFQENPRKSNPFASVYLWRTEQYFDFFSKFFPEYGTSKYPPQEIGKLMESKLKSIMEDEKNYPSLELIFGKEKHSLIYEVDKIEYWSKTALRPTVFLALMPLFSFENTVVNIISNEYPTYIHVCF